RVERKNRLRTKKRLSAQQFVKHCITLLPTMNHRKWSQEGLAYISDISGKGSAVGKANVYPGYLPYVKRQERRAARFPISRAHKFQMRMLWQGWRGYGDLWRVHRNLRSPLGVVLDGVQLRLYPISRIDPSLHGEDGEQQPNRHHPKERRFVLPVRQR